VSELLSQVKRELEDVQEKLDKLVKTTTRDCTECKGTIKGTDVAFCDGCGAPPHCDGCGADINQGYCPICAEDKVSRAVDEAAGNYPHLGIRRVGACPDQLLDFLKVLVDTCCRSQPKPCARCQDALYLNLLYAHHLGEVRT
jgi:hypothetical protein